MKANNGEALRSIACDLHKRVMRGQFGSEGGRDASLVTNHALRLWQMADDFEAMEQALRPRTRREIEGDRKLGRRLRGRFVAAVRAVRDAATQSGRPVL